MAERREPGAGRGGGGLELRRAGHVPLGRADRVSERGAAGGAQREAERRARRRQKGRERFDPFFDIWFDTSLFPRQAIAPFTLRNFPTRFPDVRTPMLNSWEISAYKEFRITERVKFQLRGDLHNGFQNAYFGRLIVRPNSVTDTRFGQLDPAQQNQVRLLVLIGKIVF